MCTGRIQTGKRRAKTDTYSAEHDFLNTIQVRIWESCSIWKLQGIFYTRLQNPTNDYVAAKIASLEGGSAAMLTSSGQAANFYAVFNIASCGDHVVASSAIYGGTYNLFAVTMKRMGVEFTFVSPHATREELDAAFKPNTKAVFGETIANPALTVLDIETFAEAAHAHGVPLIIDNTFCDSGALQTF